MGASNATRRWRRIQSKWAGSAKALSDKRRPEMAPPQSPGPSLNRPHTQCYHPPPTFLTATATVPLNLESDEAYSIDQTHGSQPPRLPSGFGVNRCKKRKNEKNWKRERQVIYEKLLHKNEIKTNLLFPWTAKKSKPIYTQLQSGWSNAKIQKKRINTGVDSAVQML